MKIRPVNNRDIKRVSLLFRIPEFRLAYGSYMDESFYKKYIDKNYFLLTEDNNKVIGAIIGEKLKAQGAIIWYLAVKKDFRGEGTGTKLIQAFEKNCKKKGIKWIMFHVLNKNATRFSEKHNYKRGEKCVEYAKELK